MVSILDKQSVRYSDFTTNLSKNPVSGKLIKVTNADSVKQAIRNLMLINYYEIPGRDPRIGGNIRALLFENVTPITAIALKEAITDTINNYEPRAVLHQVIVSPRPDKNAYTISIVFSLINNSEQISYNTTLERIR